MVCRLDMHVFYIYQVFLLGLSWISKNSLQVFLLYALEQGSANYILWAKGSPPPILLNHIMLSHEVLGFSHTTDIRVE